MDALAARFAAPTALAGTAALSVIVLLAAAAARLVIEHGLQWGALGATAVLAWSAYAVVAARRRRRFARARRRDEDARTIAASARPARHAALVALLAEDTALGRAWTFRAPFDIVAGYAVGAQLLAEDVEGDLLRVCDLAAVYESRAPRLAWRPPFFGHFYMLCPNPAYFSYRFDSDIVLLHASSGTHLVLGTEVVEAYKEVVAAYKEVFDPYHESLRLAKPKGGRARGGRAAPGGPVWVATRWCCTLYKTYMYVFDAAAIRFSRHALPLEPTEWVVDAVGTLLLATAVRQRVAFALDLAQVFGPAPPTQPLPRTGPEWWHVALPFMSQVAVQYVGVLPEGCAPRFLPASTPAHDGHSDGAAVGVRAWLVAEDKAYLVAINPLAASGDGRATSWDASAVGVSDDERAVATSSAATRLAAASGATNGVGAPRNPNGLTALVLTVVEESAAPVGLSLSVEKCCAFVDGALYTCVADCDCAAGNPDGLPDEAHRRDGARATEYHDFHLTVAWRQRFVDDPPAAWQRVDEPVGVPLKQHSRWIGAFM